MSASIPDQVRAALRKVAADADQRDTRLADDLSNLAMSIDDTAALKLRSLLR